MILKVFEEENILDILGELDNVLVLYFIFGLVFKDVVYCFDVDYRRLGSYF